MAKFLIAGDIVDTDSMRVTYEDVAPAQLNSFVKGLGEGEDLELEITSWGGNVPAGLAICNILKMASAEGHKTTAHVIGVAASMASAIACACDELRLDSNSFLMIHNPWSVAMGDAADMRKEADNLDKMRDALLAVYRTKFDLDDDTIKKMMDDETWIIGKDAETVKLKAEIIPTEAPLMAAAFAGKKLPKWLHTPQTITDLVAAKPVEAKAKEKKTEDVKNEDPDPDDVEELRKVIEILKEENAALKSKLSECEKKLAECTKTEEGETVTKAECEKRVSGMQASMQKQINDFKIQLTAKDGELTKAKAEVTRLTDSLKNTEKELSEMTSALAEKTQALDKLNANVNSQPEEIPTMQDGLAKCATPAAKVAFLKSGKYTK